MRRTLLLCYWVLGLSRPLGLVILALTKGKNMEMQHSLQDKSDVELLTASNFCIWTSIVLKCGCAPKFQWPKKPLLFSIKLKWLILLPWKWSLRQYLFCHSHKQTWWLGDWVSQWLHRSIQKEFYQITSLIIILFQLHSNYLDTK